MADETKNMTLELTAEVVSAYVGKNALPVGALPELISSVSASIASLGSQAPEKPEPVPAVNPKKSVFPDYIVCLEDGKRFKSLKRHIASFGLSPEEYRAKWNLRRDYPMVAPNYAAQRSELAKQIGLGRKPAATSAATAAASKEASSKVGGLAKHDRAKKI
jgi:predicted transcriptional regulator